MNLVNPPSQGPHIAISFLNFISDPNPRTLFLAKQLNSGAIPFASNSNIFHPKYDSAHIYIGMNIDKPTSDTIFQKFSKNLTYTYFAIPSPSSSTIPDMIVPVSSTSMLTDNPNQSFIGLFNADPSSTYSLYEGCSNGNLITAGKKLGEKPGNYLVSASLAGQTNSYSLVKQTSSGNVLVGIYQLEIKAQQQYVLIAYSDAGVSQVKLFNLLTQTLQEPQLNTDNSCKLRILNFSKSPVAVNYSNGLNANVNSMESKGNLSMSVCNPSSSDEVYFTANSSTFSKHFKNFTTSKQYNVFVFDSTNVIMAEKKTFYYPWNGKALIRVVNGSKSHPTVNLSTGARNDPSNASSFIAAEVLGKRVEFGDVSSPVAIDPGSVQTLPLCLFTGYEPSSLYVCSLTKIEPNKSYFIVVSDDDNGNAKLTVIDEDNQPESAFQSEKNGVFAEIINGVNNSDQFVNVTSNPILNNIKLYYASQLTTVLEDGSQSVSINGVVNNSNVNFAQRLLLIASSDGTKIKTFPVINPPLGATGSNTIYRLMNACPLVDPVVINTIDQNNSILFRDTIGYGSVGNLNTYPSEKRLGFVYLNPKDSTKIYLHVSNVNLLLGKNYSIIFTGDPTKNCGAIVQQEY